MKLFPLKFIITLLFINSQITSKNLLNNILTFFTNNIIDYPVPKKKIKKKNYFFFSSKKIEETSKKILEEEKKINIFDIKNLFSLKNLRTKNRIKNKIKKTIIKKIHEEIFQKPLQEFKKKVIKSLKKTIFNHIENKLELSKKENESIFGWKKWFKYKLKGLLGLEEYRIRKKIKSRGRLRNKEIKIFEEIKNWVKRNAERVG